MRGKRGRGEVPAEWRLRSRTAAEAVRKRNNAWLWRCGLILLMRCHREPQCWDFSSDRTKTPPTDAGSVPVPTEEKSDPRGEISVSRQGIDVC